MTSNNQSLTKVDPDNDGSHSLTSDNTRLLTAVVNARDALRSVILPGLNQLSGIAAADPAAAQVIEQLKHQAGSQADALRSALKNRSPKSRRIVNAPCWYSSND